MGHGKNYHGYKPAQPAKGTARHPVPELFPGQRAEGLRHQAIQFLRQHIGGQWKWEEEPKQFAAYFEPAIAIAVRDYLLGQGIECAISSEGRSNRLSLDAQQCAKTLQCSALRNEPKAITAQFADAAAMGRRAGGR